MRSAVPDTNNAADLDAEALPPPFAALLSYVDKLTRTPAACRKADVDALRTAGANDQQIHATVQVAAYFNYINRVADALGVDFEPEMTPRSP